MSNEQLQNYMKELVPEVVFEENTQYLVAVVPTEKIYAITENLKKNASTAFDYMLSLTGVDYPDSYAVVYHLESTKHNHLIVLKAKMDKQNPKIDSVCKVWPAAELQEREVFDFFGVHFNNHPDLRRLFMDEEWQGYPLRKDYKDEINIVEL
ncbi:MAG TPA: NADH-quinone oxidoreductase chain 5 [Bacteroidales bacterium]|nr:NADH-quinone oxidoreductase chain 5 [Bacteroidales bacterium]